LHKPAIICIFLKPNLSSSPTKLNTMKAALLIILIGFTSVKAFAQSTEEENIKKAISAETAAAFKGDMDAWQRTWVHSPKVSWVVVGNGFYTAISGWDSLSAFIGRIMKDISTLGSVNIKNDSFNITSDGNMAFVEFRETVTGPGTTQRSHTYRTLVKDNNEWKLISMISHNPESYTVTPESIENSLNNTGYNLISANRLNDAIEVFRLNVKLNPNAWNTYDSLGEALALAGNKKEAIEDYEKSVKLNPKNDNGIKALEKLRAK